MERKQTNENKTYEQASWQTQGVDRRGMFKHTVYLDRGTASWQTRYGYNTKQIKTKQINKKTKKQKNEDKTKQIIGKQTKQTKHANKSNQNK